MIRKTLVAALAVLALAAPALASEPVQEKKALPEAYGIRETRAQPNRGNDTRSNEGVGVTIGGIAEALGDVIGKAGGAASSVVLGSGPIPGDIAARSPGLPDGIAEHEAGARPGKKLAAAKPARTDGGVKKA